MRPPELKSIKYPATLIICCLVVTMSGCAWLRSDQNVEEMDPAHTTIIEKTPRQPVEGPDGDNDETDIEVTAIDEEAMASAIEAALEEQMRDMMERMQRYQQRGRLYDVFGGIGYIVGIMGLLFFLLGLRGRDESIEYEDEEED